jgi:hypothetical protein
MLEYGRGVVGQCRFHLEMGGVTGLCWGLTLLHGLVRIDILVRVYAIVESREPRRFTGLWDWGGLGGYTRRIS